MNSNLLATIHFYSVTIFLVLYVSKTVLLFVNTSLLDKFTRATRMIEMLVSTLFFITGIWLLFILGAVKLFFILKFILVFLAIPIAVFGFRRKNKLLAVLSLLLIFGAYGLSEAAKKKPFVPTEVEISGDGSDAAKLGLKTYMANCAMCHGKDGKKMYRDSKDLTISTLDEQMIYATVRDGVKGTHIMMPAFSGILTDEEIAAVTTYVQTLRSK